MIIKFQSQQKKRMFLACVDSLLVGSRHKRLQTNRIVVITSIYFNKLSYKIICFRTEKLIQKIVKQNIVCVVCVCFFSLQVFVYGNFYFLIKANIRNKTVRKKNMRRCSKVAILLFYISCL